MAWRFEVDRTDIGNTALTNAPAPDDIVLEEGQALLAIERFSLTANNITYGRTGDRLGYWGFFPASDGKGIIPAWGFAKVIASATSELKEGERFYGFLPMATHLVVEPKRVGNGFFDAAAHRAPYAQVYNSYSTAPQPTPFDDHRALLQPLLVTSWLVDHYLQAAEQFGAEQIILSSASSKTALGLAWFLKQQGKAKVIGLTSPRNMDDVAAMNCYDALLPYDAVSDLPANRPSIYIDFAGDTALTAQIHTHLGDSLVKSIAIGATHPGGGTPQKYEGVQPEFFFAPTHAKRIIDEIGGRAFEAQFTDGLTRFITGNPWIVIRHYDGADGLEAAYRAAFNNEVAPTDGAVVRLEADV